MKTQSITTAMKGRTKIRLRFTVAIRAHLSAGVVGALSFARIPASRALMAVTTAGDLSALLMETMTTRNTRRESIAVSANPAEPVICPSCNGKGESMGFVCGSRCDYRAIQCFTCRGAGRVTAEHLAFMKEAEAIRADRIARRLTIRDEGKRLQVDFAEWSRIEGGRLPETDAGRRALETRRKELAHV